MYRSALLFVLLLVSSLGTATAQVFATGHAGPDGPSTLYTLDTATGTATPVGPIGFERCGALEADAAGVLFAACERSDGSNTPVLITIDPTTAAGTEVGTHGFGSEISDLSFRSDGTLFGYDANNDPEHTVITIDPVTGAGTLVGDTGLSTAGGNAMTFDAADTLYHSQTETTPDPELNTLDQGAGTATLVGELPISPPATNFYRFNAMDVDPATGTIFATLNDGTSGSGPKLLATIDPVALSVTIIGPTANDIDGIAFAGAPPSVLEIPTLGVPALVGLAMLLLVASAVLLRRRASLAG